MIGPPNTSSIVLENVYKIFLKSIKLKLLIIRNVTIVNLGERKC